MWSHGSAKACREPSHATTADAASATRRTPRQCTSASAYLAHVAIAMAHTLRAMRPDDLWRSPRYGKPGLAI